MIVRTACPPLSVFLLSATLFFLNIGCSKKPKVISMEESEINESTSLLDIHGDMTNEKAIPTVEPVINNDIHIVEILDTLPTENYIYAFVSDGQDQYWLASEKTELKLNGRYYLRGRIPQYDFYSKEHDRTFDTVFFISQIISVDHNLTNEGRLKESSESISTKDWTAMEEITVEGSTTIKDLIENKESLGGQTIQVSGLCVKVNNDIMDRNWVHIQDGTMNDFDLVITTSEKVSIGDIVTFSGVVVIDRDFGAGYIYEVIIENGILVVSPGEKPI